jgi:hypothetical protein
MPKRGYKQTTEHREQRLEKLRRFHALKKLERLEQEAAEIRGAWVETNERPEPNNG